MSDDPDNWTKAGVVGTWICAGAVSGPGDADKGQGGAPNPTMALTGPGSSGSNTNTNQMPMEDLLANLKKDVR
ncbi:uncharacterized protein PG998_013007 [Apiospora kogelbergensis]|uniref:uncharacterized protein n=1 Tax=Apiospora kogelbergensis TaxID=1337665 RepID=UPI003130ABDA